MKKIIKLIASFGLFVTLFSFFSAGYAANSQYEKNVALPVCDASNPKVQFIKKQSDWKVINDESKQIFCVSPRDYTKKLITIRQSGSAGKPRYIILNNGNDIHPGKLDATQQANVHIEFSNAHYWIVDRMSSHNVARYPFRFRNASTNNILNRLFVTGFDRGINIHEDSHNNTIQNSRIGDMSDRGLRKDRVCIELKREKILASLTIKNSRIINNEIFNCNDGFQAVRQPQAQLADYAGTIVDNNDIYNSPSMYSDCNGNRDPNGKCACSENAIDIKAGSDDKNNPMVIINNRMWGYRANDGQCGGSNDHGTAVGLHFGVDNIIFERNTIFDSAQGIGAGAKGVFKFSLANSSISNNTFYNIGVGNPDEYQDGNVITTLEAKNIIVNNNIIVNGGSWLKAATKKIRTTNSTFSCNIVINSQSRFNRIDQSSELRDNSFYNTPHDLKGNGDVVFANISDAKAKDLIFLTGKYTNSPKEMILRGAIPTVSVPERCK